MKEMKKKKLLIVLGSLGRGGAERVVSIISNYLYDKSWDVTIALLLFNKVEYQINDKVKIIDVSGKVNSRIKRLPAWVLGIRKIVKDEKPNVILAFAARINIITLFSCLGLKRKVIVSERNDPYRDGRSKLVDVMTSWLYPKAKRVVFQTKHAKTYFRRNKLQNTIIITNPISVKCLARKPTDGKIVTVGRLAEQKNQKILIDTFSEIVSEFPYAKLFIYGEGDLREQLLKQAKDLGVSEKVHLMGNVADVHEQIADAEIFVLSSNYEGLSNALLEALMMGLTCISTNCAGSNEYIEDRKNGLLVQVEDKEGLASAIREMLQDKKQAKVLRNEAQKRSLVFAKDNVLIKWYELIDEVSKQ